MKTFKTLVCSLGLAGFVFASGCGSDPVKEMEKIKKEVCACEDMECVKKAEAKMKDIKEPKEPSEEQIKKALEIMMEMEKCKEKISSGGGEGAAEEG